MQNELTGVGLMSGTSLDGLDIACCKFQFSGGNVTYSVTASQTVSYSKEWRDKLANAQNLNGLALVQLNHEFGVYCADQAKRFLTAHNISVDFIASHGHTVFHQPEKGISIQIGNGAAIAAGTGITTVCDFRSLDTALGGQGAPLVPIGDALLFSEYDACLNLGGIANISFAKNNLRIAFDICAVNIVLNELSSALGMLFDKDGNASRSGKLNAALLEKLNEDPFYSIIEKKSIGREWIEEHVFAVLGEFSLNSEDKLRTFTEHAAIQITRVAKENNLKRILVSGGGAYNKFLLERIKDLSGAEIILPAPQIIEFREAIIFALLGALRLQNKINTLSSVTGAHYDSCGGAVYSGKNIT